MKVKEISTANKQSIIPIYCKDCHSQYTFRRDEHSDILLESGTVFEECFKCSVCGHKTYYPVITK